MMAPEWSCLSPVDSPARQAPMALFSVLTGSIHRPGLPIATSQLSTSPSATRKRRLPPPTPFVDRFRYEIVTCQVLQLSLSAKSASTSYSIYLSGATDSLSLPTVQSSVSTSAVRQGSRTSTKSSAGIPVPVLAVPSVALADSLIALSRPVVPADSRNDYSTHPLLLPTLVLALAALIPLAATTGWRPAFRVAVVVAVVSAIGETARSSSRRQNRLRAVQTRILAAVRVLVGRMARWDGVVAWVVAASSAGGDENMTGRSVGEDISRLEGIADLLVNQRDRLVGAVERWCRVLTSTVADWAEAEKLLAVYGLRKSEARARSRSSSPFSSLSPSPLSVPAILATRSALSPSVAFPSVSSSSSPSRSPSVSRIPVEQSTGQRRKRFSPRPSLSQKAQLRHRINSCRAVIKTHQCVLLCALLAVRPDGAGRTEDEIWQWETVESVIDEAVRLVDESISVFTSG